MKILVSTISLILLIGCTQSGNKDQSPLPIGELTATSWTNQPMVEFPNCIDTLVFTNNDKGYYYQCEHEYSVDFEYKIENDTLYLSLFDYEDQVNLGSELIEVSRYKLIGIDNGLMIVDIRHKWKDIFDPVDKKFLDNKSFIKTK